MYPLNQQLVAKPIHVVNQTIKEPNLNSDLITLNDSMQKKLEIENETVLVSQCVEVIKTKFPNCYPEKSPKIPTRNLLSLKLQTCKFTLEIK